MKNLENFDVLEMTSEEIKKTNGGWFWSILAGAIVYEIVSDWDNFKAGLTGSAPIPN